jgi:hypothetical protein
MKNPKSSDPYFKNVNELAYFTAETVISKQFKSTKRFPIEWNYVLTEKEVSLIPQPELKQEVMDDLVAFNDLVFDFIDKKLDWLEAEGFIVEDGDDYRILSDQEIQEGIDAILAD